MNGSKTYRNDEYLATLITIKPIMGPGTYYVSKIAALSDEKVHHIIINGCKNEPSGPTDVRDTTSISCKNQKILYAWALDADPLVLPRGAAIQLGGNSNVNSIKIEAHYKDAFKGTDRITGIEGPYYTNSKQN